MKVLLFWGSGKDSAWALHRLQQRGVEVGALLTITRESQFVPVHEVPISWVRQQAATIGIPLWEVSMSPAFSANYDALIEDALLEAKAQGFTAVAFGDIHLRGCREYKENLVRKAGLEPIFPLWTGDPAQSFALAQEMIEGGLEALVVAADTAKIPSFIRYTPFTLAWIRALPCFVDPCGERGEFHTFCYGGPMFSEKLNFSLLSTIL
ncbi:MAG: ATP-binding protein [Bacteroidia bacterium]|nr:ATP-binding protein [Bacteroidia bacterium]MDW8235391.1 ATP-binding protein [Bacteroidia bacterium]